MQLLVRGDGPWLPAYTHVATPDEHEDKCRVLATAGHQRAHTLVRQRVTIATECGGSNFR